MVAATAAVLAALTGAGPAAGCREAPLPPPPPRPGKLLVAITVDWEGAVFSAEGLDALAGLRAKLGPAPVTHFVSAAYYTKAEPDERATTNLAAAVREGDELALHLHGWASLARASGVEPRLAPSFLTGTDQVLAFPDGDAGFDTDLDVYEVADLRAMVRASRRLLGDAGFSVSTSFRAGGYLATPKVLQAVRAEGFDVDSSATYAGQFDGDDEVVLRQRIGEVWPAITVATAATPIELATPGGAVLELPIAAIVDYATTAEVLAALERAAEALARRPSVDQVVVLALHQETADEFASRLAEAVGAARARPELGGRLELVTIQGAAAHVRARANHPTGTDTARASSVAP